MKEKQNNNDKNGEELFTALVQSRKSRAQSL